METRWTPPTATVFLALAIAGPAAILWLLRAKVSPGRGWCRACNAPDLWVVSRSTRVSGWYEKGAALAAGAAALLCHSAWTGPGLVSGALAVDFLRRAQKLRTRFLRCGTCGCEYEPRPARLSVERLPR